MLAPAGPGEPRGRRGRQAAQPPASLVLRPQRVPAATGTALGLCTEAVPASRLSLPLRRANAREDDSRGARSGRQAPSSRPAGSGQQRKESLPGRCDSRVACF